MRNAVGWFEIPVKDMSRAVKFYEGVFGHELILHNFKEIEMALFPREDVPGTSGALVKNEYYLPSKDGVLIYFTSFSGDLNKELDKVEEFGGKIMTAKTLINNNIGYLGIFIDSEGNRVAVHSRN